MDSKLISAVSKATGTDKILNQTDIQSLWSGYGKIIKLKLKGGSAKSVIVKHVRLHTQGQHPRGWNSDLSHQRKLHSYEVETNWYQNWAKHCTDGCRVPECLYVEEIEGEVIMVLEDLDAAGFPERLQTVGWNHIESCLRWLAHFHSCFINKQPEGLWDTGTYWHLDTRPDELEDLQDTALKKAAPKLDSLLNNAQYKTIVHGDAKLANFCFSKDGNKVAAVDFQYVGGGCGMKDVAYFIGSCLGEDECERLEKQLLDFYFAELKRALEINAPDADSEAIEAEWRKLFPIAWTDFHRFLKGWSPGHWKINSYSERLARNVIAKL